MDRTNGDKGNILIISKDEDIRNLLHRRLQNDDYGCSECEDTSQALKRLLVEDIDVALLDNDLPLDDIKYLLTEISAKQNNVLVIVVTDILKSAKAINLLNHGVYDYIIQPFGIDDMKFSLQRAVEKRRLNRDFQTLHNLFTEEVIDQAKQKYENFYRTMATLSFALEGKDTYTAGHSRRVSALGLAIGRKMALNEDDLDDLRWGGLLHDLGKVAVDQAIVNKTGKLTPEEYACVMTHPIVGATMFTSVAKNNRISEIIEYHHLSYNTANASQKITRKEIPLLARIVTLADAYDAMTSDRSYRTAFSHEQAIEEIKKECGLKFDPDIVQVFLQILPWEIMSEKRSVLIVDDEKCIRLLIRSILGNEYLILEASNGQDAIEIVGKQHPSLVLMDIRMPVKDGFSACYEIKSNPDTKNIPVIMLTAYNTELDKRMSTKVKADAFVTKPFNIMGLLETVKGYLDQDSSPVAKVS
jgi:putative two-component system response regulator